MMLKRLLLVVVLLLPAVLQAQKVDLQAMRSQAEHGDAWAQLNLGAAYDNGIGTKRDVDKAIFWYRKAAEQGLAEAQFNLAHILVDEDISAREAAEWMAKAADQGMVEAQYLMGVIYAEGIGVARDDSEARRWLQLAIDKGSVDASQYMGEHYPSKE